MRKERVDSLDMKTLFGFIS